MVNIHSKCEYQTCEFIDDKDSNKSEKNDIIDKVTVTYIFYISIVYILIKASVFEYKHA